MRTTPVVESAVERRLAYDAFSSQRRAVMALQEDVERFLSTLRGRLPEHVRDELIKMRAHLSHAHMLADQIEYDLGERLP